MGIEGKLGHCLSLIFPFLRSTQEPFVVLSPQSLHVHFFSVALNVVAGDEVFVIFTKMFEYIVVIICQCPTVSVQPL